MTIKNFWSLNVDEAIVAEKLRTKLGKNYEVFFPVNSQLKDIDLIIYNLKNQKSISVQVKASKTHHDKKGTRKFGKPNTWSVLKTSSIFNTSIKIDFIIFVIYEENLTGNSREIIQNFLVIPMKDFQKITKKDKQERKTGFYHYSFIIDGKKVLEINNTKDKVIDFSRYLNNWDLTKS